MSIKTLVLFLFFLPSYMLSYGQLSWHSEVGGGIGVFTYVGDLSKKYTLANARPAATLFYRVNVSDAVSFRASLIGGMLGASDKSNPVDVFATTRNASFTIFLIETSITFEYHFINWRKHKRGLGLTPFLFGGVGLFGMTGTQSKREEYSNVQLCIPFGVGVKYIVTPKIYLALEIGMRKTFFDYLDNVSTNNVSNKDYQYGNKHDDDAYFFGGISLNYTFYTIPCSGTPYK